jgi:hypothetical protein
MPTYRNLSQLLMLLNYVKEYTTRKRFREEELENNGT